MRIFEIQYPGGCRQYFDWENCRTTLEEGWRLGRELSKKFGKVLIKLCGSDGGYQIERRVEYRQGKRISDKRDHFGWRNGQFKYIGYW